MSSKSPETVETEKRTRSAIESYVRAWTENDRDALLGVFAEDAEWYDPVDTPAWKGRDKIGEFWDQAHAGDAQLTLFVHRIVVCGGEGVLLFRMEVRNEGGGGMDLEVCDHMTVNQHGQIQVANAFWDEGCASPA